MEQAAASRRGEPWTVDRVRDDPILLTMILRGLISKHGLGVPYTESSPASKDDEGNQPNSGNCHIHCVNYRKPKSVLKFREFFEQICSFDTEFAIDGPCNMRTLRQFISPEKLTWPPHRDAIYRMSLRGKHDEVTERSTHYNLIRRVARVLFGRISSWEDLLKKGQTMQLELIRAEFEGGRTFRPYSGGTLMWMYNDCWPALDWSIIDYYYRLKPAYYASKRACRPLLPIIFEKKGFMNFYFGSDSLKKGKVRLQFGQENLDGEVKWSRRRTIDLPLNTTVKFYSISRKELALEPDDFLFIKAVVNGVTLPVVTYFPNLWKALPWPEPEAEMKCSKPTEKDGEWVLPVTVTTRKYLRLAHLHLGNEREDATFSDNYFDLPAGGSHTVYVTSKHRIDPNEIALGHWLDWAYL
jgi:beta-mannosidase